MEFFKRVLCVCLFVLLMVSQVVVYAGNPVKIYFMNQQLTSDVEPYIENGRTMVPVRMISEKMGYDVLWDNETRKVTIVSTKQQIVLTIDSQKAQVGNQTISLDVPAVIRQNRTFVPIRFVSENFGYQVEWDNDSRSVLITNTAAKPTPSPTPGVSQKEDIVINKIFTDRKANELLIRIQTVSGRVEAPSTMILDNPDRYVLDIPNAILKTDSNELKVDSEYISKIRFSQYTVSPNSVRIVVDFNKVTNVTYGYDGGFFTITMTDSPSSIAKIYAVQQEDSDVITITSNTVLSPDCFVLFNPYRIVFDFYNTACSAPEFSYTGKYVESIQFYDHSDKTRVTITAKENSRYQYHADGSVFSVTITEPSSNPINPESSEKLIVLDPGHGGTEVGALGKINGEVVVQEKDINLNISNKVLKILKENGYNVIATRTTDMYVGLTTRADIANSANAALFVSIHNNSFETAEPKGTLTMYAYDEAKEGASFSGRTAASIMQKELVKGTEGQDRGLLKNPQIVVLRKTNMPAILVECLFMSNPEDLTELLSEERLTKIAEHIAVGIENIYEKCLK